MKYLTFSILVLCLFQAETQCQAQLFGARSFGKTLAPPNHEDIGTLDGTERFIRGNTRKTDFIGSDSGDSPDFIGSQQSTNTGIVRDTTKSLKRKRRIRVNRPLKPAGSNQMYDPKLSISIADLNLKSNRSTNSDLSVEVSGLDSLNSALARFGNVELQMDGAQATIRGIVSTEREKRMAGYLVSFEPGVDSVRNELTVQSAR